MIDADICNKIPRLNFQGKDRRRTCAVSVKSGCWTCWCEQSLQATGAGADTFSPPSPPPANPLPLLHYYIVYYPLFSILARPGHFYFPENREVSELFNNIRSRNENGAGNQGGSKWRLPSWRQLADHLSRWTIVTPAGLVSDSASASFPFEKIFHGFIQRH